MSEPLARLIREFTRIFKNEHNVDGIDHLFHPSFAHHFTPPAKPGLEGYKDVGRMMNAAFPDVVVKEDFLVIGEDRVVERSSPSATHRGSLMGEKPTNKRVAWTESHIYRVLDGKIVEHWVNWDQYGLFRQIGAVS